MIYRIKTDNLEIIKNNIKKYRGIEVTRSELIEKISSKNPHLLVKDVEKIVAVIFDSITQSLAKGERVEFRGFGAFSIRKRTPRIAKNPRTGEQVKVEERNIPHFKTGKQLHDLLNKQ